jgi:2'-5' RNA ligase
VKKFYYNFSGYGIFILPPWPIKLKVNGYREECCKLFGQRKASIPPVHITLGHLFNFIPEQESYLIKRIRAYSRSIAPFEQQLVNFGSFKSHTVFIKATQNLNIAELNYVSSYIAGGKKSSYHFNGKINSFQPHLSIAYRDLTEELYPSVWEEYKDKAFEAEFTVNNFTLVKWNAETYKWDNLHHFPLEGSKPLTLFT